MPRILVDPDQLRQIATRMHQATEQLHQLTHALNAAAGALDWDVRQRAGVDGEIARARHLVQSLADQADQLAQFLTRKAAAFAAADQQGVQSLGQITSTFTQMQEAWMQGVGALYGLPAQAGNILALGAGTVVSAVAIRQAQIATNLYHRADEVGVHQNASLAVGPDYHATTTYGSGNNTASFTAHALSGNAALQNNVSLNSSGLNLDSHANAEYTLLSSEAQGHATQHHGGITTTQSGTIGAQVGAHADATLHTTVNAGGIGTNASASGFAGGELTADGQLGAQALGVATSVGATGGVSYGIGAAAHFHSQLSLTHVQLDMGAKAAIAVGLSGSVKFDINVGAAAHNVTNFVANSFQKPF